MRKRAEPDVAATERDALQEFALSKPQSKFTLGLTKFMQRMGRQHRLFTSGLNGGPPADL